jgi:hypothetical protein
MKNGIKKYITQIFLHSNNDINTRHDNLKKKHLHIYIFTYLHIYIFTYLHIYIFTYLHIYIFTYLHIYTLILILPGPSICFAAKLRYSGNGFGFSINTGTCISSFGFGTKALPLFSNNSL